MKFEEIILETKRLKLRKLKACDSDNLFDIYSDRLSMKYWSSGPITDKAQSRKMIENTSKWWDSGDAIYLGIECKERKYLIGTIFLYNFHNESKRAEVGYILSRSHWGLGIMSEVLNTFINYAFSTLKLNRIEADIDPNNKASGRLLKKIGFNKEGRLKERWIVNNVVSDSEIYGITRNQYSSGNIS